MHETLNGNLEDGKPRVVAQSAGRGLRLFFVLVAPGRGLWAWDNAGDVRVFRPLLARGLRPLKLGVGAPLFLFLAFFLPCAFFGSFLESGSGPVRHGSLLKGHL